MADPYRKLQELLHDRDDIISMYSNNYHKGGRARVLMGYVDKWDEVFGKGFFAGQVVKEIKKRQAQ